MGFRFQKRISILPGVRMNLGLRGTSLSVGPRGASVTMGKRGVYGNVGIPGSGLSYRTRLDRPGSRRSSAPELEPGLPMPTSVTARLIEDEIFFYDEDDRPIVPSLLPTVRRFLKEDVERLLDTNVEARNEQFGTLSGLHHDVPLAAGDRPLARAGKPLEHQFPDREAYMLALMTWRAEAANSGPDQEALEQAVLNSLGGLDWPRETNISIELRDNRLLLDVDLPEIEDMPTTRWQANMSQMRLIEKPLSQKDIAATYLGHVASLMLRLIGHSMAVHNHIGSVGLSAYTQRNSSVGRVSDEYVAVADISRDQWSQVDCSAMHAIDPENLLRRFGARLETNSRGVLKVQQPLQ